MAAATVPEKIVAYLRKNRGTAFCDDCIQKQVGLTSRHQAQLVTLTLAICQGFTRAEGKCPLCQSNRFKQLTKAN